MDFSTAGPVVLGVVLAALLGAIAWLIKTVIGNAADISRHDQRLAAFAPREEIADKYVRREDYVPQITHIGVKLDAIGEMVSRLDERSRTEQ